MSVGHERRSKPHAQLRCHRHPPGALPGATALASEGWRAEWPRTDFAWHTVPLDEIISGGPPKDGIPSIDQPKFVSVPAVTELSPRELVIGLVIDGDARAYPLASCTGTRSSTTSPAAGRWQ